VGTAFFVWDHGTKHGNIQVLGALSYAAPLLSTLLLIAFGHARASWVVGVACLLIVGGAVLASRELLRRPERADTAHRSITASSRTPSSRKTGET
jgi:drug/metabolite transporter (DMT)-like permease